MKRFGFFAAYLAATLWTGSSMLQAEDHPPGVLYVTFHAGAIDSLWQDSTGFVLCGIPYIDSVNRVNDCQDFRFIGHPALSLSANDYHVIFPESADIPALAAVYKTESAVRWARPDYYMKLHFTPNDSLFLRGAGDGPECYQWSMDSAHCQFEKAWDITQGDTSVVIAMIDDGFFYNHPDIKGNLWINGPEDINQSNAYEPWPESLGGDFNGEDDDNNGFVDDVIGYNFPPTGSPGPLIAPNPHGTFTASIASGVTNNAFGISGAGFKSRLMLVSVHTYSTAAQAIQYAALMQPDVMNMSFGFPPPYDSALILAIENAFSENIVLVASAGNEGNTQQNPIFYPAADSKVLSVTGVDIDDVKENIATFNEFVDLSAPIKAWAAQYKIPSLQPIFTYGYGNLTLPCENDCPSCPELDTLPTLELGTSWSAPLVAGAAALVKSAYPNMTNEEIMAKLKSSTDSIYHLAGNDSTTDWYQKIGTGRLNAFKAVTFFDTIPKARTDTALSGTIYISGDLLIPAGKTVTLSPGTVLKFYPGDIFNKGNAPKRGEIIVKGTLVALGTSTDSIKFISYRAAPQDTDWYAVRVDPGGSFNASYCQFKNAYTGIDYRNTASNVVQNCLFEKNYMHGIISKNPALKILNSSFLDHRNYAVYLDQADDTISGCYFKNNQYGINAYKSYGKVSNNTIIAKDYNGTFGFRAEGYQAGETRILDFTNNLDSGQFYDAAVVANNRVKVQCSRIRIVRQAIFPVPDPPPSNIGIWNDASHPVTVRTTVMRVSGYTSNAAPNVQVDGGMPIDLGQTGADAGNNSIVPGTGGKAVLNNTGNTVLAKNNWWGTASPPSSYFSGPVDRSSPLGSEPTPCSPVQRITPGGEDGTLPRVFSLAQNYPNPFNPTTNISFSLPVPGKVVLTIYNILGQKVRTLAEGEKSAGTHTVIWDGTDSRGVLVSSGIYFYKIETASFREVKRMVFVK